MASPRSLHDPMIVPLDMTGTQTKVYPVTMQATTLEYKIGVETPIVVADPTEHDYYDGDYVVTPKAFDPTVLETYDKIMRDDVTVLEIPYYETSNLGGGYTVFIAGEVEING